MTALTTPQQLLEAITEIIQENSNLKKALQTMKELARHQQDQIQTLETTITQQQIQLKTLQTHIKYRKGSPERLQPNASVPADPSPPTYQSNSPHEAPK